MGEDQSQAPTKSQAQTVVTRECSIVLFTHNALSSLSSGEEKYSKKVSLSYNCLTFNYENYFQKR